MFGQGTLHDRLCKVFLLHSLVTIQIWLLVFIPCVYIKDQGRFYEWRRAMEGSKEVDGAQLTTDKLAPAILVMQ